MSEFIDRLAKVGWESEPGDSFSKFEELPWPIQQRARQQIRAILAEAREAVTDEMLAAAAIDRCGLDTKAEKSMARAVWQAAIDIALAPDGLKTAFPSPVRGDLEIS